MDWDLIARVYGACNGGEVTDRPQDPTYGKRSQQIPDIKEKAPERFAAGQGAGTGLNSRYQKIEGVRVVEGAPVSPVRKDTARHNSWSLPGEAGWGLCSADTEKNAPDPKKNGGSLAFFALLSYLYISYLKL